MASSRWRSGELFGGFAWECGDAAVAAQGRNRLAELAASSHRGKSAVQWNSLAFHDHGFSIWWKTPVTRAAGHAWFQRVLGQTDVGKYKWTVRGFPRPATPNIDEPSQADDNQAKLSLADDKQAGTSLVEVKQAGPSSAAGLSSADDKKGVWFSPSSVALTSAELDMFPKCPALKLDCDPAPGADLYELTDRVLGSGGFGTVFVGCRTAPWVPPREDIKPAGS